MSTEAIADTQDQLLVFTQAAAQKVAKLIEEEGKPNLMLRLYIYGNLSDGGDIVSVVLPVRRRA